MEEGHCCDGEREAALALRALRVAGARAGLGRKGWCAHCHPDDKFMQGTGCQQRCLVRRQACAQRENKLIGFIDGACARARARRTRPPCNPPPIPTPPTQGRAPPPSPLSAASLYVRSAGVPPRVSGARECRLEQPQAPVGAASLIGDGGLRLLVLLAGEIVEEHAGLAQPLA